MTRIRVNTEDLKAKAKDFESAADAFNRAGDDIAAAAAAMPSYDGQLSGPARKAGAEIQSLAREMKTALSNDAQSLRSAAQGFDAVENQTTDAITSISMDLADSNPPLDHVTEEPYYYKYWDDVRKEWVTQETLIIRHTYPHPFTEEFDRTTREGTVTLPDGTVVHTKTVQTKNTITDKDTWDWFNKKNKTDAEGGALFDTAATFALLAASPMGGLFASLGLILVNLSVSGYDATPFLVGDTQTTTAVEKVITHPDGSTENIDTVSVEIKTPEGNTTGKVIANHSIQNSPDGNSVEKFSTASEIYSPEGTIDSRVTEETRITINNGEALVERYTITETFNPDGSLKSTDTQKDILDHKLI